MAPWVRRRVCHEHCRQQDRRHKLPTGVRLPHCGRRDGTLVAFLKEVPGKLGTIREFFVVLRVPGRPDEMTAAWMSEGERQQCCRLDDERKKTMFDAQLGVFRSPVRRPTAPLDLALLSHLRHFARASAKPSPRSPSPAHTVVYLRLCPHPPAQRCLVGDRANIPGPPCSQADGTGSQPCAVSIPSWAPRPRIWRRSTGTWKAPSVTGARATAPTAPFVKRPPTRVC